MKAAKGHVFKYGDNVDTDVIIPARYLNSSDPKELATHCMEDIDKDFVKKVKAGDIIVANKNFGCGSSREHAPIAIKASGVSCVIAETFARIFYRNAINIGLPIIECPRRQKRSRQEMRSRLILTRHHHGQDEEHSPIRAGVSSVYAEDYRLRRVVNYINQK